MPLASISQCYFVQRRPAVRRRPQVLMRSHLRLIPTSSPTPSEMPSSSCLPMSSATLGQRTLRVMNRLQVLVLTKPRVAACLLIVIERYLDNVM